MQLCIRPNEKIIKWRKHMPNIFEFWPIFAELQGFKVFIQWRHILFTLISDIFILFFWTQYICIINWFAFAGDKIISTTTSATSLLKIIYFIYLICNLLSSLRRRDEIKSNYFKFLADRKLLGKWNLGNERSNLIPILLRWNLVAKIISLRTEMVYLFSSIVNVL